MPGPNDPQKLSKATFDALTAGKERLDNALWEAKKQARLGLTDGKRVKEIEDAIARRAIILANYESE